MICLYQFLKAAAEDSINRLLIDPRMPECVQDYHAPPFFVGDAAGRTKARQFGTSLFVHRVHVLCE